MGDRNARLFWVRILTDHVDTGLSLLARPGSCNARAVALMKNLNWASLA